MTIMFHNYLIRFVNYCSSRTLINTVEAAITNAALYFYDGKATPSSKRQGLTWQGCCS